MSNKWGDDDPVTGGSTTWGSDDPVVQARAPVRRPEVAAAPSSPKGDDIGPWRAGMVGTTADVMTPFAKAADMADMPETSKYIQEGIDSRRKTVAERYHPKVPSYTDIYKPRDWAGSAARLAQYGYEGFAESAPQMAGLAAAGLASAALAPEAAAVGVGGTAIRALGGLGVRGSPAIAEAAAAKAAAGGANPILANYMGQRAAQAAVGRTAAGFAGAAAADVVPFTGSNLEAQMKTGKSLHETSLGPALGGALVQAPLDTFLGEVLPGVGKAAAGRLLTRFAKKAAEGVGIEATSEGLQQVIEIAQADPEKLWQMDPETQKAILEAAIKGGFLGGAVGGVSGAMDRHQPPVARTPEPDPLRLTYNPRYPEEAGPPPPPMALPPPGFENAPPGMSWGAGEQTDIGADSTPPQRQFDLTLNPQDEPTPSLRRPPVLGLQADRTMAMPDQAPPLPYDQPPPPNYTPISLPLPYADQASAEGGMAAEQALSPSPSVPPDPRIPAPPRVPPPQTGPLSEATQAALALTGQAPAEPVAKVQEAKQALESDASLANTVPTMAARRGGVAVEEDMRAQLLAAGRSPQEAQAGAKWMRTFYERLGTRLGAEPFALYKGRNISVQSGAGGPRGGKTFHQDEATRPGIYSQLSRQIANIATDPKSMKTGTGQQWLNLLEKRGVKAEEMQWSDLGDVLEGSKDHKLTIDELQQLHTPYTLDAVEMRPDPRRGRADDYSQWTLGGFGGSPDSNYRQVVLTESRVGNSRSAEHRFGSNHFPGLDNPVAHYRTTDRSSPTGDKVMLVEEIQSDLHQAGRERGYRGSAADVEAADKNVTDAMRAIRDNVRAYIEREPSYAAAPPANRESASRRLTEMLINSAARGDETPVSDPALAGLVDKFRAAYAVRQQQQAGVPDFPFKQSWPNMVFKHALIDAIKSGKDYVAWPTGEQQADHYHLADPDERAKRLRGMQLFYDKRLVEMANKFGKPYDAKVESLDISPPDTQGLRNRRDNLMREFKIASPTRKEAIVRELASIGDHTVHGMKITPAMRELVSKEGLSLFQGERAKIRLLSDKTIIQLLKDADASSFLHETAHLFLEEYIRYAPYDKGIAADLHEVNQWLGVPPGREPTREQHEKFAKSFERWVQTGKAPSNALRAIFRQFAEWLAKIYGRATAIGEPIPPNIEKLFARMLAEGHERSSPTGVEPKATPAPRPQPSPQDEFDPGPMPKLDPKTYSQDDKLPKAARPVKPKMGRRGELLWPDMTHTEAKELIDAGWTFTNAGLYEADHAPKGTQFRHLLSPNGKDRLRYVRLRPPEGKSFDQSALERMHNNATPIQLKQLAQASPSKAVRFVVMKDGSMRAGSADQFTHEHLAAGHTLPISADASTRGFRETEVRGFVHEVAPGKYEYDVTIPASVLGHSITARLERAGITEIPEHANAFASSAMGDEGKTLDQSRVVDPEDVRTPRRANDNRGRLYWEQKAKDFESIAEAWDHHFMRDKDPQYAANAERFRYKAAQARQTAAGEPGRVLDFDGGKSFNQDGNPNSVGSIARRSVDLVKNLYGETKAGRLMDPLGRLVGKNEYLKFRNALAKASTWEGRELGGKALEDYNKPKLSEAQHEQVMHFLETANANPAQVPFAVRARAVADKQWLIDHARHLVDLGVLPREIFEANKGAYVPRLYLKYLLDNRGVTGAGIKPNASWTKPRDRSKTVEDRAALGEIRHPGIVMDIAMTRMMRDEGAFRLLDQVAADGRWSLGRSMTTFTRDGQTVTDNTGKPVKATPEWLMVEANAMEGPRADALERMGHRDKAEAMRRNAVEMRQSAREANAALAAAVDALPEGEQLQDRWKQLPDTINYGRLRGAWVAKDIANDITGMADYVNEHSWLGRMFGDKQSKAVQFTQFWKMMKVPFNPGSQVRNGVSNLIAAQVFAGVPMRRMIPLVLRAAKEMHSGGAGWDAAKRQGIPAGTMAENELYVLTDMLKKGLDNADHPTGPMGLMRVANIFALWGKRVGAKATEVYGATESVFKTAVMMHAMESRANGGFGMSEADAAILANEALFDYSLVHPSIRYARNAPLMSPFITYTYKMVPQLGKTLLNNPLRFLPYVALTYALPAMVAGMFDLEDGDIDKMKMALADGLRRQNNMYLMPGKNANGDWHFIDIGYFFPWQIPQDIATGVVKGDVGEATKPLADMAFSNPVINAIVAMKTNIDPFTKRKIVDERDPLKEQAISLMSYIASQMLPTALSNYGALGKLYDKESGTGMNRYGEPSMDYVEIGARLAGINMYPVQLQAQRARNLTHMQSDIQQERSRMTYSLKDQSLTVDQRRAMAERYRDKIMDMTKDMQKYARDSAPTPSIQRATAQP